jgi:hypothetical protein
VTKDESRIKDWRSTGRRIGRRVLYENWVDYECVDCGVSPVIPPKDAPSHFEEIWPEGNRTTLSQLQVDHEDKDYTNNDFSNLNWRCPQCHKLHDMQTEKGVSTVKSTSWVPDLAFLEAPKEGSENP